MFLTNNVVKSSVARSLVLFALFRLFENVRSVGQFVKIFLGLVSRVEHGPWWHAQNLDDLVHLVNFVSARKKWLARVHFDQDATKGPHVDGQVVRNTQ